MVLGIRKIVAPLTFGSDENGCIPAAISAAKVFAAHLDMVFMRPDPETAYFYSGMLPSSRIEEEYRNSMEEAGAAAAVRSRRRFGRLCRNADVKSARTPYLANSATARWRSVKGDAVAIFPQVARTADLAVFMGRISATDLVLGNVLEATLLGSGTPVLFLPEPAKTAFLERPLIAWDGGTACVRAVSAWLSMEVRPREAIILHVSDPEEEIPHIDGLKDWLAWNGIATRTEKRTRGDGSTADGLMTAARELDCDMIVMGGYGRFRYSEALFGGVTWSVIRDSHIPVLMMH
jgi:nucleotide-binding universal stress UspA family protein